MKQRSKPYIFAVLVLGLAGIPAVSFASDIPDRGPIPFASFDSDSSGDISPEEFDAAHAQRMRQRAGQQRMFRNAGQRPAFADIDTDNNGRVSEKELQTHQQQRRQMRMNRPQGQGMGSTPSQ